MGIIRSVVSVSVYYFAAGLLVPEGIIRSVVSVSVMIPSGTNSPAAK
jgi:hypothetical protein